MFQGTMIDELISSVERVEQRARERQEKEAADLNFSQITFRKMQWRESSEVA
ncbi:MAG TPA: hypothetical protein VLT16_11215 [Candidatus Limnocylindrales bacterium]|nr:hypothetical protein [Candidatus Limnocylindrales bacterium]